MSLFFFNLNFLHFCMFQSPSLSTVRRFFHEIFTILQETDTKITEFWYKISEIKSLTDFDKFELNEFLGNFEFIAKKDDFIKINKILFVFDCIKFLELDIKNLSEILDFKAFEALIREVLSRNGYNAIKNFRFSDKSNFKSQTSQKRYEIDVIGIKHKYILIIDAKQWKRRDSFAAINKAANSQYQRVIALKKNPEVFSSLIHKLLGNRPNIKKKLPFILIPMMVTLEDNSSRMNDNQVPLVSIYRLNAFLQEYTKYLDYYKTIEIKKVNIQTQLF